jgi:hypothetical protein
MHCYKCGEPEPSRLSVKRIQRSQSLYICRLCRMIAQESFMSRHVTKEKPMKGFDSVAWAKRAEESRRRILANHS